MDINITLLITITFVFMIAFIFFILGQGGGSVYSPLLILLGFPILLSTSTSLVLNLITSVSAGYIFYRNKMINFKTPMMFVPGISVGAFLGEALAKFVNTTVLLWPFVFFLTGLGARMVYTYWEKGKVEEKVPKSLSTAMYTLIAFSVLPWESSPAYSGFAAEYSSFLSWSMSASTQRSSQRGRRI